MKLLMKLAQFINNYQKFTLVRPMMKQFVLQSCFFYVLPRHTNKMTDKGFNRLDECAGKFVKILLWHSFFLIFVAGWTSMGGVKNKWGSSICYYIATLSLFHFFKYSQYPEKWSVSFKNFFRKCGCMSCYLLISSNLQFQF